MVKCQSEKWLLVDVSRHQNKDLTYKYLHLNLDIIDKVIQVEVE